jgi:hypothetical protein
MSKRKHKLNILRKSWLLVGIIIVILLALGFGLMASKSIVKGSADSSASPKPSVTPTTTASSPMPGNTVNTKPTASPAPAAVKITPPILQKSSGNNGPVSVGALVEFVCRTESAQDCSIVLTESSSGKIITLSKKTTQSDGRATFGSTWDWTAVVGIWKVVATSTRDGVSSNSTEQTITVQ